MISPQCFADSRGYLLGPEIILFFNKKTFLFSDTKSGFPKGIWKRGFQKRYEQTVTYAMSPSVVLGLCKTLLNQSIFWFWSRLHKAIVGNRYPHEPQDFQASNFMRLPLDALVAYSLGTSGFLTFSGLLNSPSASAFTTGLNHLIDPNRLLSFPQECTNKP